MTSVILQGFSQGVVGPCIITIMVRWTPDNERSTIIGTIFGSFYLGRTISHSLYHIAFTNSPNFLTSHYVGGAVGLLWCVVWYSLAYNSPTNNPYISELELSFFSHTRDSRRSPDVPWRKIFKSRPFLVLLLITCADEWKCTMLHTVVLMPYYTDALHQHFDENELLRMVEVANFPTAVLGGVLSDWFINNYIISRTMCRKIFSFIGVMVPTFLTVLITVIGCDPYNYMALNVITFFFFGFTCGSIPVNAIDLCPRYAGLITAMTNTGAMFISIFPAYLVNAVVEDRRRLSEWSKSFWVSAAIVTTLSVPYFLYGSGEKQPWVLSRRSATLSLSVAQDTDHTAQDQPSGQSQEPNENN
uniref:Major facilitator superfamily (MFS) profile domain-containing protein n=2 Tax=Cuerna arida TaxID=1464854 RepID=A0A1B6EXB6_9HEMI